MTNNLDIKKVAVYLGLSLALKGLSVSPLKLQKILYYTQSWFMVYFGRENTLFREAPQAWVNGPVYPTIYNEYKDKAKNMCDHLPIEVFCANKPDEYMAQLASEFGLTNEQIEFIESVILLYGAKSQNQLIFLTHSEQPWADARSGLQPFEYSTNEISLDSMYSYYHNRHQRNISARNS